MLPDWSHTLSHLMSADVQVTEARSLGGGCISDVFHLSTRSHHDLVVKRNSVEMVPNFRCEAAGLQAIADANAIRVPEVVVHGEFENHAYLVIRYVRSAKSTPREGFARFGTELAELHRCTRGSESGWKTDNFLGSAPQKNDRKHSWVDFVAENRIGFQLRWAVDQGLADGPLKKDCELIVQRMSALLAGREDETSLLHGDLWSGNYLFDEDDAPVLIDPAVYLGCREAEWGMITWLGGCPAEFESAYQSAWPMPDGWRRRVKVYLLYHQLNHLNLFGGGYRRGCEATARDVLNG